ncbi:WG repeat-containing protein [Chryseobacterium sp. G0162]|uniref:WG repeat-containing protein n=1 Tax=Chryseobacterium sp. G0162 TaxID=2487063 RepID=UPI000F4EE097|nr:WG repeat-containing protein [Chryseobacterium sp. G0162]AZB09504.1 WG repeat-containing protein [Chryseobacterium sp. G0162]
MRRYLPLIFLLSCTPDHPKITRQDIDYFEKDKNTDLFRVHHKNGKWGFVDKDTITIIPFKYDFINPFDENGLAYTKDGSKEFYINKQGKVAISSDYDEMGLFSEGLLSVKRKGKYGFLDTEGNVAIPMEYDEVGFFSQGLCGVSKNKKHGFIDPKGRVVIPIIYDAVDNSDLDSIVIASKNGKWAFFDSKGKQLSDFMYDKVFKGYNVNIPPPPDISEATTYFQNGAVLVLKNKKYEFLNEEIKSAFQDNIFDLASVFDTYKNAIVKRNNKYGIIKPDGIAKVPIEYDWIGYFGTNQNSSEYYNAKKGNIFHIYNRNLKKIGESYEKVSSNFSVSALNLIFKNLKGQYGMVNSNGSIVIPFEYSELEKLNQDLFLGKKNGKVGILDKSGRLRIPFEYKSLDRLDDNGQLFIADDKIINLDNKPILSGYDRITPIYYNNQRFIVSKNKKYGIVDIKNKILLPLEYDEISNWVEYGPEKRHFIVKKGKHGLIEYETFRIIIPPVYDEFIQRMGVIFAHKNGKSGILDINNKEICPFIFDEIKPGYFFGIGYRKDENRIYSKKDNKFYEITLTGKIIKEISQKEYKKNTEHQNM